MIVSNTVYDDIVGEECGKVDAIEFHMAVVIRCRGGHTRNFRWFVFVKKWLISFCADLMMRADR